MRDPRGADVVMWTCGSTNWADMDPHGCERGAVAQWVKQIGPTGRVGPKMG